MTDRFRPAARMADIAPFHVMEVMGRSQAAATAGRDVVHMEVGEPDFSTAEPIVAAGIRALRDGHTHYTLALGLPALRAMLRLTPPNSPFQNGVPGSCVYRRRRAGSRRWPRRRR